MQEQLKMFKYILVYSIICLNYQTAYTQPKDTMSVLFVGNSYTYSNNLPQLVSLLSGSGSTYIKTRKSTAPGAKLSQHWHGHKDLKTKYLMDSIYFDMVILQEYSLGAIEEPDSSGYYFQLFIELARQKGIQPFIFQTWSRAYRPQDMSILDDFYHKLVSQTGVPLIPVGKAWQKTLSKYSDLTLYAKDGSHPDKVGTYLSVCVILRSLTGNFPNNPPNEYMTRDHFGETIQLMYVEDEIIAICKSLAEEVTSKSN